MYASKTHNVPISLSLHNRAKTTSDSVEQSFSTDTLVYRDGIGGVSRETGVSHVCREKMGCHD